MKRKAEEDTKGPESELVMDADDLGNIKYYEYDQKTLELMGVYCMICRGVAVDPVDLDCPHRVILCDLCFAKAGRMCPVCKQATKSTINSHRRGTVANLELVCKLCPFKGTRPNMKLHIEEQHKPTIVLKKCIHCLCDIDVKTMDKHVLDKHGRRCIHVGCEAMVKKQDWCRHVTSRCSYQLAICPMAGCRLVAPASHIYHLHNTAEMITRHHQWILLQAHNVTSDHVGFCTHFTLWSTAYNPADRKDRFGRDEIVLLPAGVAVTTAKEDMDGILYCQFLRSKEHCIIEKENVILFPRGKPLCISCILEDKTTCCRDASHGLSEEKAAQLDLQKYVEWLKLAQDNVLKHGIDTWTCCGFPHGDDCSYWHFRKYRFAEFTQAEPYMVEPEPEEEEEEEPEEEED